MMSRSLVVMFCGPHDEGQGAPTRRISRAIQLAVATYSPLAIAGDGNHGRDVELFRAMACDTGVPVHRVHPLYDEGMSTLADAKSVARLLATRTAEFADVGRPRILLVTDDWHMERASAILRGEIARARLRTSPIVVPTPVRPLVRPPEEVLLAERQGIVDYMCGDYGRHVPVPPYGKPAAAMTASV